MPKYLVQHRRGTAEQWADQGTLIPREGEIVIEIDEVNSLHKLKIGDGVHTYAELAYLKAGDEIVTQVLAEAKPRVITVELSESWAQDSDDKYYQTLTLDGITNHSRLDLQPSVDMLAEFKQLGLVFVTENNSGAITVYSVGNMPQKAYTMQATIVETECDGEDACVIGAPIGTPVAQSNWSQTDNTKADFIKNKPTLGALAAKDEVAKTDLAADVQASLGKADTAIQSIDGLATEDYVDNKVGALGSLASKSIVEKTDLSTDVQASLNKADTALQSFTETDPTVPSWAKEPTKPSYTASEVHAVPDDRKINGKSLSTDITLKASDIGALPNDTPIPSIDGLATTQYVDNAVAGIVDSSPEALNTLNELAAALGDDPNFATTVANEIGKKANADEVPKALADLTADSTHRTVTDAEKTAWNAKSNFSGNYNDLTNLPPSLPASGGNADTVDGKHADDFAAASEFTSHINNKSNPHGVTAAQAGAVEKTTHEYNKELAIGQYGKVCIGKFPMYDSNITVEINSTTNTTYHGTLVIATQNINESLGGTYQATVYGDATNSLTDSIKIEYLNGSRVFSVYINLPAWSKNLLHIQCVALRSEPTDIATLVDEIPSTATIAPTNALNNYVPASRTINGKALGDNITLSASDIGLGNVSNERQYSVSNPPPYPVTSVNGKTGAVSLSASDIGALPSTTPIPTVNNATLTIQKNGANVATFTANSATDTTANITVPTGAAADKGVDTNISAASTSTNLPTSKAVAAFVEGKGYKTTDNDTTYTIAAGDSNGQIKVTPSSGSAYNVSIKGLGSAAYTASSNYATAAQGTKADNAVPNTRTVNGKALSGNITLSASDVGAAASSHNQAASTITAGTFAGQVVANASATASVNTAQVRNIYAGTTDMTAGSSSLETGCIYFVYE